MKNENLLNKAALIIKEQGLFDVARKTGISVGHLHHIVFRSDLYPLTERMEAKLRKIVEEK